MMRAHILNIALAFAVSAIVVGCGGGAVTKAPVTEESSVTGTGEAGAETGTAGGSEAEGSLLGSDTQMAMAAQRPDKLRVHFEFDSSSIDGEARAIVEAHAAYLAANPDVIISLEGHADERGTREYNLALGERRGNSVERMLRVLGVTSERLNTVSYGEERPLALGHGESSWRLNRRVEFIY
ncbi:MAG: peptidoglycan-associated lipoprotein Pal [Acidiferrobacterales bacterium]